ncbi:M48 family metalloprotease [Aestuariibacter salexigens]|uniref:beta-barrel assembly-enhancing protease n=1 Tax=Aestuariibacter salexigens TaxID=226010 RepID=UPI0004237389|nr:M48 family metalloprotease [Aestuariibacter salexigens]
MYITRAAVVLLSACASVAINAQSLNLNDRNALPEIGVVASDAISLDKEKLIGDAIMRQLRGQAPLISDPLLEEYVQDLGNRLVVEADNAKFPFTFFLINNPDINAFAFFGGHIGIHTGLIVNAQNESELASVFAHEISHVTQRHIARRIQAAQRSTPLQIASMLGGVLLALANPEAGVAAISAGSAAAQQAQINYTRSNEQEADRVGIQMLANAGFDPRGAGTFFEKLAEKYRLVSKPPAFLLTHPLPESRIADARARADSFAPRRVAPSLRFHLAKARIQARYFGDAKRNIEIFQDALDKQRYVFRQAAEYGLALSYLRDEQVEKAELLISKLNNDDPENLFYLDTLTDIGLELKQPDKVLPALKQHAQRTPRNPVVALNLANASIKIGDFDAATQILRDFLLVNPEHYLSYQLLTEAYGENNQMLEMHQSRAEVYALVAAYPRAIDELQHAYNFAADRHLEKQRIRARIEQFRTAQERLRAL